MQEVIKSRIDSIRRWPKEKAGMTVFGSHLGSLVLTSERLLFISSGGSKLLGRALGGVLGGIVAGKVLTSGLELGDLCKSGSLQIPLDNIRVFEARRRWDGGAYLAICFQDDTGTAVWSSFMTESGVTMSTVKNMENDIKNAKDELAAARRTEQ